MRATLQHVAAPEAFERMFAGQERLSDGLDAVLERRGIPWSITRSGARCELQFMPTRPRNGTEAKSHFDWQLVYYTHQYLANRGVLTTPFHNMMLVPSMATDADIDRLVQVWNDCLEEMVAMARKR